MSHINNTIRKNEFQFTIDTDVTTFPIRNKYKSFTDLYSSCNKINDNLYIVAITWTSFERKDDRDGLTFGNYHQGNKSINIIKFGGIPIANTVFQFARFAGKFTCSDSPTCPSKMAYMFLNATEFNSDLSKWNVENVTNMNSVFHNAKKFNSDLSKWNVSNVTIMTDMFNGAEEFNADLSKWNVSNVTRMSYMFNGAKKFNSDLFNWNVSNVVYMNDMFNGAEEFAGNLSSWNISNVVYIYRMFYNATNFDKNNTVNWNFTKVPVLTDIYTDEYVDY